MKFGKTLARTLIQEWARYYISYKALKQHIKDAVKAGRAASKSFADITLANNNVHEAITEFNYTLDRELEKVNNFFLYKKSEIERRIRILDEKYKLTIAAPNSVESSVTSQPNFSRHAQLAQNIDVETEIALLSHALETKDHILKVMRYTELNRKGFRKILKKFDKKLQTSTQTAVYASKIQPLPFSSDTYFSDCLTQIESLIQQLYDRITSSSAGSRSIPPNSPTKSTSSESEDEHTIMKRILREDDAVQFQSFVSSIHRHCEVSDINTKRIHLYLLSYALHYKALKCVTHLIQTYQPPMIHSEDINQRSLFHRLVSAGGKLPPPRRRLTTLFIGSANSSTDSLMHSFTSALSFKKPSEPDISALNTASNATKNIENEQLSLLPKTEPLLSPTSVDLPSPQYSSEPASTDDATTLNHLIDTLYLYNPNQLIYLYTSDIQGRKPLHYAALGGHTKLAECLIRFHIRHLPPSVVSDKWIVPNEHIDLSARVWYDNEGFTPLFYAVLNNRLELLKVLIDEGRITNVDTAGGSNAPEPLPAAVISSISAPNPTTPATSSTYWHPHGHAHTPLAVAAKLGHTEIAAFLLSRGANINITDPDGETPLHLACRNGYVNCVDLLLKHDGIKIDVAEEWYGFTPLILAAIEGHSSCVESLVEADADINVQDYNSWTALDHAAFRGHMQIAGLLKPHTKRRPLPALVSSVSTSSVVAPPIVQVPEVGRAYGHKYLRDQSVVVIYLGTNSPDALSSPPVTFSKPLAAVLPNTNIPTTTSLSLVISATNSIGEPAIIDLPIQDVVSLEPIVFFCNDPQSVTINFDIQPTYFADSSVPKGPQSPSPASSKNALARGVLALGSVLKPKGKDKVVSSGGVFELPMLEKSTLNDVGKVIFEYIVIRPFKHKDVGVGRRNTYWKSVSTKIIGHRGLGANRATTSGLQLGENTVLSFVTAASLGAEYVEFDVQLTKDYVPVLYHDWIVNETGFDIPVNSLSLAQFKALKDSKLRSLAATRAHSRDIGYDSDDSSQSSGLGRSMHSDGGYSAHDDNFEAEKYGKLNKRFGRSQSFTNVDAVNLDRSRKMSDSPIRSIGIGKFKGNGDNTIQAPFALLEDAFKMVPQHIGFNIEVKYPNPDEILQDDLYPAEINLFIDKILECVYNHAGDRNVIFSSFHPETCLLLNFKQPNFPVFLLTEGGTVKYSDVRCNSLQEAVRFAKYADLMGIVTVSDPLIDAPYLIKAIKETGLLLFTYGSLNNIVELAKLQRDWGVDAVIVDSVLAVRKGLQHDQSMR
ncbi:Glycerophosphoryl diester phosphodiesterase family-domain-containing protein [Paraphysoderma sedebokerense]|nr:Glycerophosphoryl diester phosphodiesterase family-domain-containing protein [Paraphysoderma sedebokerense]KAI9142498.1 Glycerophosphoryl diester phosphodiesterase family-domain-containing protein [Paraphysoderma sedebokerense]